MQHHAAVRIWRAEHPSRPPGGRHEGKRRRFPVSIFLKNTAPISVFRKIPTAGTSSRRAGCFARRNASLPVGIDRRRRWGRWRAIAPDGRRRPAPDWRRGPVPSPFMAGAVVITGGARHRKDGRHPDQQQRQRAEYFPVHRQSPQRVGHVPSDRTIAATVGRERGTVLMAVSRASGAAPPGMPLRRQGKPSPR